jgi:predicted metal-dependent hydrolase
MHQAQLPLEPDIRPHLHEAAPDASSEARRHSPGELQQHPPGWQPHANRVFVRHPRARRYVIRVQPDGSIRVTIPRRGSKREAEAFVIAQRQWIERQRVRVAQEQCDRRAPMPSEELRVWRRRAQEELPPRLLALAEAFSLTVTRVSIRNQRWRWGSCSRNGHITLNWRLVTMPDWVRDYVLIHELMHLKRMDHSPAFWKLVAAACPGYQAARKWLRANASH